jgi:hypothetical protein
MNAKYANLKRVVIPGFPGSSGADPSPLRFGKPQRKGFGMTRWRDDTLQKNADENEREIREFKNTKAGRDSCLFAKFAA